MPLRVGATMRRCHREQVVNRPSTAGLRPAFVDAVETLLSGLGRSVHGLAAMIIRANYNDRGRVTAYLFEDGKPRPSYVVKLARSRRSRAVLAAERDAYGTLAQRSTFLSRQRPRYYSTSPGLDFVLEEFVTGGSLDGLHEDPAYQRLALEWLAAFQNASAGRTLDKQALLLRLAVLRSSESLRPFHPLLKSVTSRVEALEEFGLAEVPVHGDFAPSNLLLDGQRLYVTDWEWLRLDGWPLDDLWWFLLVSAKHAGLPAERAEASAARMLDALLGKGPGSKRMRENASEFAAVRRTPRALIPVFAVITLAEMTLRWRVERIDWQTAPTAVYEHVLRSLDSRSDDFWSYWQGYDSGK